MQSRTLGVKRAIIILKALCSRLGASTQNTNYYHSQRPINRRPLVPVTPSTTVGFDIAITLRRSLF